MFGIGFDQRIEKHASSFDVAVQYFPINEEWQHRVASSDNIPYFSFGFMHDTVQVRKVTFGVDCGGGTRDRVGYLAESDNFNGSFIFDLEIDLPGRV